MAEIVYSMNRFPEITVAMHKEIARVVRETAKDIVTMYASTAPKKTGFMASSAYVVTSEESTYGQVGTPPGDSYLLPEVEKPADDLTAYAAVAANYAVFLEMGTRFMPAQPAFYPAVELARGTFDEKLATVEARIKAVI